MRPALILALVAALGCGNTPEDDARDALGDTDHDYGGEAGPLHRPGQPCLLCHGFQLAGTVYRFEDDRAGVGGASVHVTDGMGRSFTATTNSSGNFYVTRGGELEADDDGELELPYELEYPLAVEIEHEGITQPMRSLIWREGSCAHCHGPTEGESSAGRIVLEEAP
jgi:hypothetical protein